MNDFLNLRRDMGGTKWWAFKDADGNKCKHVDFQEDFFELFEDIQGRTKLIGNEVDVREEYELSRSFRRGSTTHA